MFQCELLPACRELNANARTPQSRLKFTDSFVRNLECRSKVRNVVDECKKFFTTDRIIFDQNPNIFSFANSIVLDLQQNEFRFARPSDLCRRASLLNIPHRWLVGEAYLADTSAARTEVWSTLWSIFRRDGPFHPGDKVELLGTQEDELDFHWLISLMARLLEGKPLGKCVMPFSDRGRNSKGLLEKCIEGLFGEYYSEAPNTVFCRKKGDENQHDAAGLGRQGRRVIIANEVGGEWDNASF